MRKQTDIKQKHRIKIKYKIYVHFEYGTRCFAGGAGRKLRKISIHYQISRIKRKFDVKTNPNYIEIVKKANISFDILTQM